MDRDSILIEVFNESLYRGFTSKFYPDLVDEMITELILSLDKIPVEKLQGLHDRKELKYYCIRIIRNLATNKKLSFIKAYVNDNLEIKDDILSLPDTDTPIDEYKEIELLSSIKDYLADKSINEEGSWYDERLFNMYFNDGKSHRGINKSTNIPLSSVYNNIKKTQNNIKDKFKNKYDELGY